MSDNNINSYREKPVKIDMSVLIRDLLKDFWLIAVFGLSVAMCTYIIYSLLHRPAYKSSATFAVTTKGSNVVYTNLAAANMVAETLTRVFSSTVLENKVTKDLQLDEIPGKIEAQLIDETNLFVLTVTAASPQLAYQIINSIMDNYTNVTDNIFGNAILNLLEAPKLPAYPDNNPNYYRIMMISCLLGMAAMTGLLAYLSIKRDNIKNEDELVEKLNTRLLGVVYHERKGMAFHPLSKKKRSHLKKRKSLLISSATVSFSFAEAIKKIRARYEYKASQMGGNVLLVTSVLNDVLEGKEELSDAIRYYDEYKIAVLACVKPIHETSEIMGTRGIGAVLEQLKEDYDCIILDSAPSAIISDTLELAKFADGVIYVIRQDFSKVRQIQKGMEHIVESSRAEIIGCVLNNVRHLPAGNGYGYGYGYYGRYGQKAYKRKINVPVTDQANQAGEQALP